LVSGWLEREEVEQLYREHARVLVLFACATLGERTRAQDIVHQVFLRLIEHPVRRPDNPQAYLFAAVHNAARNEVRSLRRMVALDESQEWFDEQCLPGESRDPLSEQSLRRALWSLTEEQRQVTVMHVWGEMTFPAIGVALGISANTAASRYRYALAQLREQMKAGRSTQHVDSR
jgi:RNA polymerase sigma-70 factor, ECF subfamily